MKTRRHEDMVKETWKKGDVDMETWRHGHGDVDIETWRHKNGERQTEAKVIFLNPFIVCSSCKWKFVICPFADEEKNVS
jgi:hypothetical protein